MDLGRRDFIDRGRIRRWKFDGREITSYLINVQNVQVFMKNHNAPQYAQ
jgi:hypothetical protein